uniref:Fe2OG dioxygenase domain-containing protein n=2 Tax=Pseudo-nitzschia australis TaxID=44445 RepID=A0A7S4EN47_9STRA
MEILEEVPVGKEDGNTTSDNAVTTSNQKKGRKQNNNNNNNNRRRQPNKKPSDRTSNGKANGKTKTSAAAIVNSKPDENLCSNVAPDPRGEDPEQRMTKKTAGRNSESFDPKSTVVRPALRVQIGSPTAKCYNRFPLKHDDVVIVPELFGPEDDWSLYYKLVEEMTDLQQQNVKGSEWISWHEGAHLVAKNPSGSKTFQEIIDKLCDYFQIQKKGVGTRFNWYKDSSDWKPFHHDSAAFNPSRAKTQNITVGVSFGDFRELAFLRADDTSDCRLYFPQPNNGVFSFGRDVNIRWKHGINSLSNEEQVAHGINKGRVSIILWGLASNIKEEANSPSLLGADGKGPHAAKNNHKYHGNNKNRGGRRKPQQKKSTTTTSGKNADGNNSK